MGKIRRDDLARAVDGTDLKGQLLNTGIAQGVGLFSGWLGGRKKSKEMQSIELILQRLELVLINIKEEMGSFQCKEYTQGYFDGIEQGKKLGVEDE